MPRLPKYRNSQPIKIDAFCLWPKPPVVEKPALTLVTQLKVGKAPGLRLQATGIEMGDKDLSGSGPGMFTGYYLLPDTPEGTKPEALNFTAGKVTLARAEGAKSRVTLTFAGAAGELVPSGKPFTLDGTITATVGAR
mgnify:CR=1 FL=1